MEETGGKKRVERFPKSARLLKRAEFRFKPYKKFSSRHFDFFYTENGKGRIGISLSKKVLKAANARNRIKRMLRESFRKLRPDYLNIDVHVLGRAPLTKNWEKLKTPDIRTELEACLSKKK